MQCSGSANPQNATICISTCICKVLQILGLYLYLALKGEGLNNKNFQKYKQSDLMYTKNE